MSGMEPPLTGLWAELQRVGGLRGTVFKSCESELMELMRQIDLMMESRKAEWSAQRKALQTKLELREQEGNVQSAMLEKKTHELGQLKQKVRDVEKNQSQVIAEYERQLTALREEVLRMRKEYERVKKQYNQRSKEKAKAASELEGTNEQMQKLTSKLEEYRQKCRDLEHEKRSAQKQIESLESQKRTLTEKCELVQQQTASYQSQLDRRRDMLDSTETNLRTQITQLEGQLARTRDSYGSQDTQLQKLRGLYEESMAGQRHALQEKEQLQAELGKAHNTIRSLESELSEVRQDLSVRSSQIGASQSTQQRMRDDVNRLEQALAEKDANIQSIELERTRDRLHIIQELQTEINSSAKVIKKLRKTEQTLRAQVGDIQSQLDQSRLECSRLTTELATRDSTAQNLQVSEVNKLLAEINKLKQQLEFTKERHLAEVEGMKRQIVELTTEGHERDTTVAGVTEKAQNMERTVRDQNELLDRKTAELEVANAQLEALRLENRHLRQTPTPQGNLDVSEAEGHLKDLETAYSSSLKALEEQNLKLQDDVNVLRKQLHSVESSTQDRLSAALKETQQALMSTRHSEQRTIQDIQQSSEQRLQQLQSNHQGALQNHQQQVQSLQGQVQALERQLRDKNQTLQKLGLEREVMTHFVDEVDELVQHPPHRENSVLHSSRINTSTPNPPPYEDDSMQEDSVEMVTARFLAEQDERTRQLEQKLNAHIDELRAEIAADKYT